MKTFLFGILTALLAGLDLRCKSYVEDHFQKGEEKTFLSEKVQLRKVHNKGMALNIGDAHPVVVRIVSGIVCVFAGIIAVSVWLNEKCIWKNAGISMVLAGAISNTYDRFVRKYVVDYFGFQTKWKKFNKVTFNLGDIFIFLGCGIWVIAEIFGSKK